MMTRTFAYRLIAAAVMTAVALTIPVGAQSNRAEKQVAFKIDGGHTLDVTAGPVKISTVKITNLGRGYGRGGFPRPGASASELSTTVRLAFDVNNPKNEDWDVTFTVEFLDKAGKVIDRAAKNENYEGQSETFNFDHSLLEYVLPAISDVRLTFQAKLD